MMRAIAAAFLVTWSMVAAGTALAAESAAGVKYPEPGEVLQTLTPGHPRLLLDADTLARIKRDIAADPVAAAAYASLQEEAESWLKRRPSIYEKRDGRRLLDVSRSAKECVRTLGFVYLLEGGDKYKEGIWAELEAVTAFPDWNPAHFLDTAEMTHAVALGYDWLYSEWSEDQRRMLREAIIRLGLEPAMKVYASDGGWHKNENNWNQVCNGGIGMGALAIAGEVPELAAKVICNGVRSIPRAMSYYAPDGAGTEGVTYWDYGSRYNVIFLEALRTALGTDFGLHTIDGFAQSGDYQIYLSGAGREAFDFGDCGTGVMSTAQHLWFGRAFEEPRYSWYRYSTLARGMREGGLLDLLWYDAEAKDFDPSVMPLDRHFRKAESASMRSAWGDPDALVLAIQSGKNSTNGHRHLDLGSFCLEALGVRWAIDSGREHETYMGHVHHLPRYSFYRTRAEGHNTLVLNPDSGNDQNISAKTVIAPFVSNPDSPEAGIDLSSAYAPRADLVRRTFSMPGRRCVVVRDEVRAPEPAELWWFMHTQAKVTVAKDGRSALLEQLGKQLRAALDGPAEAKFEVMDAAPLPDSPNPAKQESNKGRRKLAIHLQGVRDAVLSVTLTPVWE